LKDYEIICTENNKTNQIWLFATVLLAVATLSVTVTLQNNAEAAPSQSIIAWRSIASGVEYAEQKIIENPILGDGTLHIVRIDTAKAKLRSLMSSQMDKQRRTARKWCSEFGMVAVINAGMYDIDYLTHVGYLRSDDHVNNAKWAKGYNSVLVFDPLQFGLPSVQILDDVKDHSEVLRNFGTVIQNLRLIKGEGQNVWKDKSKKWSEAAIAIDKQGRVLFLFIRSPLSLNEFNEKLLVMPLDITHAMHLEGGPEASLSICTNELQMHLSGSDRTGFMIGDSNLDQRSLPNIIGIMADKK
jgi:hypothetical protein